jgi:hypothetical protein
VPTVLKSGNLNLLEASGPVKACNGIACFAFMSNITNRAETKQQTTSKGTGKLIKKT